MIHSPLRLDGAGLHRGFRHVVGQPPVGGAARLGQAVREQELRIVDDAREPALLQVPRRQVAQQHRHLPDLHQLVGEAGIAARDLLGDDREGLRLGALVQLEPAELLRHAERADARPCRRPRGFRGGSRSSGVISHSRCQLPRMNGITTSSTKSRHDCRIRRCSSDSPCAVIGSSPVLFRLRCAAHAVDNKPRPPSGENKRALWGLSQDREDAMRPVSSRRNPRLAAIGAALIGVLAVGACPRAMRRMRRPIPASRSRSWFRSAPAAAPT